MGARVLVVDDSQTLRKVVSTILCRAGYQVLTACDGQAALQTLACQPAELVLLDFVMPRMNGYQFCRELRSIPQLRDLPVVLMSAKAERIRDQFLRQTGAIDAITKPFDARALIAVVEGALQRSSEGRAPQAPEGSAMPAEESLQSGPESIVPSLNAAATAAFNSSAQADLARALAGHLAPAVCRCLASQPPTTATIETAIEQALRETQALSEVLGRMSPLALIRSRREVLCGDVSNIPMGEILQVLQMQRQTGVLEVSNGSMEVSITLRDGLVDLAQSRGAASPEFLLGRYFLDQKLITNQALDEALREASASGSLLGDVLVSKRLVSENDLRSALIRQTSEVIYEVLRWKRGWYLLRRQVPGEPAQSAKLGLPVAAIVMEGFRRVDEWRLIEEAIDFDQVLVRDEAALSTLRDDQLTDHERNVLAAVDGSRSVRDIIDQVHQSSFDVCKTCYRLLQSRLVRRKAA